MNKYVQYLHTFTLPYALPTAVTPVLTLAPRRCAIRLHPRTVYHRDGRKETREQFSHMIYTYTGEQHGFLLLRTPRGTIIGRKVGDVRFAETAVEKAKVAA